MHMSINVNNVLDLIQDIIDKHKGFISVSEIAKELPRGARNMLGIKSNASGKIIMKKLGAELEERFILRQKGRAQYILTPCEPEDLLLSFLDENKPITQKELNRALRVLQTQEVASMLTEMVNDGRIRVVFDAVSPAKFFAVSSGSGKRQTVSEKQSVQTVEPEDCTVENFRAEYDELHKFREFVRICDLRRKLNWPREVFDEMIRTLRDNRTIQLYAADESMLARDEIEDCFVDETNYRMGIMIWNGR